MLGFGYILPATFLPVLAREVVDDPQVFGLAWPVFGIAAAISTIVAARSFGTRQPPARLGGQPSPDGRRGRPAQPVACADQTIAIAALLVGSTFMVVTMIGMQEARARAPGNPTAMLGLMTAAFAIGQMAGPVASGAIDLLPVGHLAALDYSLQIAAAGLALSAAVLWRLSRPTSSKGATMMQANAQRARQGFAADMPERLPCQRGIR